MSEKSELQVALEKVVDKMGAQLARAEGKPVPMDFKGVGFEQSGTKIILPVGMSTGEAMTWLQRKTEQDEQAIIVNNEIDCYPVEGAWALMCVLQEKFGFVGLQSVKTMFGENPPHMIGVEVTPGHTTQVPWGNMAIPGIDGILCAGFDIKKDHSVRFTLNGKVKRKSEGAVREVVDLVRAYILKNSLFRGKAIQVVFPNPADDGPFSIDVGYLPKVMDVSGVKEDELIFPHEVEELVQTSLFAPIEHAPACRELQIPLKRGILLEGPYGVGKTLTAFVTAKKCVENGWTFIYIKQARDLDRAIAMAKQYQPCVIFAEDLDSAVEGNDRTDEINAILNTIDGIDAKGHEVMVVVTTNHVENINKAMLRPGRLDAIIPVRAPDAIAAARLMRLYARDLIPEGEDLTAAAEMLAGHIPAFIREAIERSKLSAVRHAIAGRPLTVTANDLITAANSMNAQVKLLQAEVGEVYDTCEEDAAAVLGNKIIAAANLFVAGRAAQPNGASKAPIPSLPYSG